MRHVYEITEKNIDGKGTDAREFVASSRALHQTEIQTLKQCLDSTRTTTADTHPEWDTYDRVREAIETFHEKTGRNLHLIDSMFTGQIEF